VTLAVRVLAGLIAGFIVGLALSQAATPTSHALISAAATLGVLFINLIRMTVIPLVVSMLVSSVGSAAASRALARAGWRAAAFAVTLLAVAAILTVAIAQPVLSAIQIDPAAAAALRA